MRVGSIVYSTEQGLGILGRSFYDDGAVLTDVVVLKHPHYGSNPEWYPNSTFIENIRHTRSLRILREFVEKMDCMLYFETPFVWDLIHHGRTHGKKSILMPMYECTPKPAPAEPDLYICPSPLDLEYYPDRSRYIPVPVKKNWRLREKARVFVHNAGRGGLNRRNGTGEVIDSIKHIKSPIKLIIRSQKKLEWGVPNDPRVEVRIGTIPYDDLFEEGDVFLFPEKFNGLSLPLQEACASGMLVMTTNRNPNNKWLPIEPLIPIEGTERMRVGASQPYVDSALISPEAIAKTIDEWYDRDIASFSHYGKKWAELNSWEALRQRYMTAIENLVRQN